MFRKEPALLAHALSLTFCSPLIEIRVEQSSGVSCCGLPLTSSHSPKELVAAEIWPTWSNDALKIMRCCERRMRRNGKRAAAEEGGSGRRPSAKDRRLAAVGAKLEEGNIRAATPILFRPKRPAIPTHTHLAAMQERHPKDNWAANL